jgi:hypothetical protein
MSSYFAALFLYFAAGNVVWGGWVQRAQQWDRRKLFYQAAHGPHNETYVINSFS